MVEQTLTRARQVMEILVVGGVPRHALGRPPLRGLPALQARFGLGGRLVLAGDLLEDEGLQVGHVVLDGVLVLQILLCPVDLEHSLDNFAFVAAVLQRGTIPGVRLGSRGMNWMI